MFPFPFFFPRRGAGGDKASRVQREKRGEGGEGVSWELTRN